MYNGRKNKSIKNKNTKNKAIKVKTINNITIKYKNYEEYKKYNQFPKKKPDNKIGETEFILNTLPNHLKADFLLDYKANVSKVLPKELKSIEEKIPEVIRDYCKDFYNHKLTINSVAEPLKKWFSFSYKLSNFNLLSPIYNLNYHFMLVVKRKSDYCIPKLTKNGHIFYDVRHERLAKSTFTDFVKKNLYLFQDEEENSERTKSKRTKSKVTNSKRAKSKETKSKETKSNETIGCELLAKNRPERSKNLDRVDDRLDRYFKSYFKGSFFKFK